MHPNHALTGLDTFVFGVPLIALLVFGYFRLDEVFASSREPATAREDSAPAAEARRQLMMSDPDGQAWQPRKANRRR